ncbi:MAG: MBL fold metallo-hydrolase [Planctomycetes bacterium]|nr:MBL fold metallo-hydrolase [Planctomycetota bacterium]NOG55469.1 MBL fold metallo-hydrolase [Planctomycetota bacterium]
MSDTPTPSQPIDIKSFTLGPWQTNCYIVRLADSPECWIVDAGFEPEPMIACVKAEGLRPTRVILTHAHVDHIGGLSQIRAAFPECRVAIHADEKAFLGSPDLNLSGWLELPVTCSDADDLLADNERLTLAGTAEWVVFHTPGHSPGGITLYHEPSGIALVGDTLFAGSIGRYDFPTSNGQQLFDSIGKRLLTLPDETQVFPGHGPPTTIGQERRTNPFLT